MGHYHASPPRFRLGQLVAYNLPETRFIGLIQTIITETCEGGTQHAYTVRWVRVAEDRSLVSVSGTPMRCAEMELRSLSETLRETT